MKVRFREWWQRPIRTRDRVSAAFVGLIGGFWIGALGRLIADGGPVSIGTLFVWGVGVAVVMAVVAAIFPKHATVVLFPFSIFGIGGN